MTNPNCNLHPDVQKFLSYYEPAFVPFFEGRLKDPDGQPFGDLHGFIASQVYGEKLESVSYRVVGKEQIVPSKVDVRHQAKVGLFSWLYGSPHPEFDRVFPALAKNKTQCMDLMTHE